MKHPHRSALFWNLSLAENCLTGNDGGDENFVIGKSLNT